MSLRRQNGQFKGNWSISRISSLTKSTEVGQTGNTRKMIIYGYVSSMLLESCFANSETVDVLAKVLFLMTSYVCS